ncbi:MULTISPECIES: FecCD family ABC transporter permease [unclassified Agarivorans]|uniref:FecCD family ABC transporter permease n=1 Tax=unclassified Agarivorans TaxID=2636026 RepID=UPI003D7E3829
MNKASALTLRTGPFSLTFHLLPLLSLAGLSMTLVAVAMTALLTGSEAVPFDTLLSYFHLGSLDGSAAQRADLLILDAFRAPRICLAMLCGAMLGCAGAVMQSLTRNGLADPSILGVREGAALAIVSVILMRSELALIWRPLLGMAGGLAAGLSVKLLAKQSTGLRLVMIGICLSWLLSAVMLILLSSSSTQDLQTVMLWLAGDLQAATWSSVQLASLILLSCALILILCCPSANIEALGDALATSLGVRRSLIASLRFCAAVLLVATSVSVAGGMAFVGLIAPHLARLLANNSERSLLLGSGVIGALLVLSADTLARAAFSPLTLPTGIILSVLGAPSLIFLLWMRRDQF